MKAPINWLKRYVDIDLSASEIMEILTSRGLEVESIERLDEEIENVVVGKILSISAHPNADKLVVCQVDTGSEKIQIVTGATNLKEGDVVPVAKHGAKLPGGKVIKRGKLRGELSDGMLCSGAELNLTQDDYPGADEDGILVLQENYDLGENIAKVLGLDDCVLCAEPTPNRPDLLCIIGIAREIAAATGKEIKIPKAEVIANSQTNITDYVKVDVKDADLCPRYIARTVNNITIQPSPMWMRTCLRAAGMRPINNIVDITNFVMLETGQPLHAFDLACVEGEHIIVRRANSLECAVTLDGKNRSLPEGTLVIADPNKAVGIAGIMGGQNSEIKQSTKTILFESALFNGPAIRRSAKAMGMMTEASLRFCKGIDIEGTQYALERACALVEELQAGSVEKGVIDVCNSSLERRHIIARVDKVNTLVALDVKAEKMVEILNGLGMKTSLVDGNKLDIEIPFFRNDMEGEADVSEEIARVVGYQNIPLTLMKGDLVRGKLSPKQQFVDMLKQTMSMTFYEAYTYAFTGEATYDKLLLPKDHELRNSVSLLNPFGEDNSLMRTTCVGSMLNVLATNAKRKVTDLRFFEISNVHSFTAKGEIPLQKQVITIGMWGKLENFSTLKGIWDRFFEVRGYTNVEFVAGGEPFYHPYRKAEIYIDGVKAGSLGEIHPEVADNFEIPNTSRALICQLDVDILFNASKAPKRFESLPKYPVVDRDLSIVVNNALPWGEIKQCVIKAGGANLRSVDLFDVYNGQNIKTGCKSVAFSMQFRSDDRTLLDEDVNTAIEKIIRALKTSHDAELRA